MWGECLGVFGAGRAGDRQTFSVRFGAIVPTLLIEERVLSGARAST
jgi:hypothetical protein